MFAEANDLATYGYDVSAADLLPRADIRVRGYLSGRASATNALTGEVIPEALVELVCAVATRMAETSEQVAKGIGMEVAGSETLQFGSQAYAGVVGLTATETAILDRMFPRMPRSVEL